MRIQVSLDNVDAAVALLEKYANDLDRKVEELTRRIAEVGAEEVASIEGVQTTVEPIPNGHSMTATNDAIVFMEFGTGAWTDESAEYAKRVSVPVYPGSWSKGPYGAGEWVRLVEQGGMPEEEFPYNHYPKRGMYLAAQRMKREAIDIAREIFR